MGWYCHWNDDDMKDVGAKTITIGQKYEKVENDENRFFAITSSKLFKN